MTKDITAANEALRADLTTRAKRKGLIGDDRHAYVEGTVRLVNKQRDRKSFKERIVAPLTEKGRVYKQHNLTIEE